MKRTLATLAGALLLTACGQTTTGVAARVGDAAIESSSFAERVARSYRNDVFAQKQPKEIYQRELLSRLVVVRLMEVAARRRNVTVSEAAVDAEFERRAKEAGGRAQFERATAVEGVAAEDLRSALRNLMLEEAVMDDLVKDVTLTEEQLRAQYRKQLPQYDTAVVAHILLRDAKRAQAVAKLAKAPGADFGKLAAKYSADDESGPNGGELGRIGNGEGRFAKEFEQAVFSARTGDIVGPVKTVTAGDAKIVGYEIIKVIERTTRTFEQVRDDVRRTLLREERSKRYVELIRDLAAELGVKVNPRFGRWDHEVLGIVPAAGGQLSSPSPDPLRDQPAGAPPGVVPGQ